MRISLRSKVNRKDNYDQKFPFYQQWESFIGKTNLDNSPGLNKAFQSA